MTAKFLTPPDGVTYEADGAYIYRRGKNRDWETVCKFLHGIGGLTAYETAEAFLEFVQAREVMKRMGVTG